MMYCVETPTELWYSGSKIDATYKHIQFLYRDRAKYFEISDKDFESLRRGTRKSVYLIVHGVNN